MVGRVGARRAEVPGCTQGATVSGGPVSLSAHGARALRVLYDSLNLFLFLFRTRYAPAPGEARYSRFAIAGIRAVRYVSAYRIAGPAVREPPAGSSAGGSAGGGLIMELVTIVHVARATLMPTDAPHTRSHA